MTTVVQPGDDLVVLALDDAEIAFVPPAAHHDVGDRAGAILPARPGDEPGPPEHVVVFGWSPLAPLVLRELDAFVPPGSLITVAIDPSLVVRAELDDELAALRGSMTNARLVVRDERDAGYAALVEIVADGDADHALVLCYRAGLSIAEADARALVTTLQVQRAMTERGRETTIVTELLDQRDVALAPRRAAGDFIVSDRLVSLLLTQVAENPVLIDVFEDLLAPEGSELYCKAATRYVEAGRPTTFGDLVAAAADRGESAIGYRHRRGDDHPDAGFGIVLNPAKASPVTLGADDQVIVIAERG